MSTVPAEDGPSAAAVPRRSPSVVQMSGVRQAHGSGPAALEVLCGIDLDIPHGDYVAVTGPAVGPGKAALSALFGVLGCLEPPAAGEYRLDGVDVSGLDDRKLALVRNRALGFVFQTPGLVPRTSAFENVELPLAYAKVEHSMRRRRAQAALGLVELTGLGENRADRMPAIEQHRVAIARALVTTPCLILADEPTGELDAKSGALIMELLDRLNGTGRTIVLVTRDDTVAAHAKRIIRLSDGVIAEDKRIAEIDAPPPLAGTLSLPRPELAAAVRSTEIEAAPGTVTGSVPDSSADGSVDGGADSNTDTAPPPPAPAEVAAKPKRLGLGRRRGGGGGGGRHAGQPELEPAPRFESPEFDISLPPQLMGGRQNGHEARPARASESESEAGVSHGVGG